MRFRHRISSLLLVWSSRRFCTTALQLVLWRGDATRPGYSSQLRHLELLSALECEATASPPPPHGGDGGDGGDGDVRDRCTTGRPRPQRQSLAPLAEPAPSTTTLPTATARLAASPATRSDLNVRFFDAQLARRPDGRVRGHGGVGIDDARGGAAALARDADDDAGADVDAGADDDAGADAALMQWITGVSDGALARAAARCATVRAVYAPLAHGRDGVAGCAARAGEALAAVTGTRLPPRARHLRKPVFVNVGIDRVCEMLAFAVSIAPLLESATRRLPPRICPRL